MTDLYNLGAGKAKNGRLLRIINVAYGSTKFIEIERINFPIDVIFHPFGLYYEDNTIYVLNHAFHKGGSRIDVFDYKEFKAYYTGSVLLDNNLEGSFGDLIVINKNIYLTQYSSEPFSESGMLSILKRYYKDIAQIYESTVYKCPLTINKQTECTRLNTPLTTSVTGITKSKENLVYISYSSIDYN